MRYFMATSAILLVTSFAMAHQNTSPGQPSAPNSPRMASDDVLALLEKGEIFFLDVREPSELAELGTFEGYVNIPLGQLEKRLNEIPKNKPIVTA